MVLCGPPATTSSAPVLLECCTGHTVNLAVWRRKEGLSDACKLCGLRQTLAHVLNQCPIALQLRRYNTRHDAVLEVIEKGIRPLLCKDDSLLADLHSSQPPYTFPPQIAHTDLRPDLVLWNANKKKVCLIELTICFETRYEEAHSLKEGKYIDLVEEISSAGVYNPQLITLEVGSRGPFYPAGFERLQSYISGPDKHWETIDNQDCSDGITPDLDMRNWSN